MIARVYQLTEARQPYDVLVTFVVPREFVQDANVRVGGVFDIGLPDHHVTPKIRADRRRAKKRRK